LVKIKERWREGGKEGEGRERGVSPA